MIFFPLLNSHVLEYVPEHVLKTIFCLLCLLVFSENTMAMKLLSPETGSQISAITEDTRLEEVAVIKLQQPLVVENSTLEGTRYTHGFSESEWESLSDQSYSFSGTEDINTAILFSDTGSDPTFLPVLKIDREFKGESLFVLSGHVVFKNIVFDLSELAIDIKDFILEDNGIVSFVNCHYLSPLNAPEKPFTIWKPVLEPYRNEPDGAEQITEPRTEPGAPDRSIANFSANDVTRTARPNRSFRAQVTRMAAQKRNTAITVTEAPNIAETASPAGHKTVEMTQDSQDQSEQLTSSHSDNSERVVSEETLRKNDESGLMLFLSQDFTPRPKELETDTSWIHKSRHKRRAKNKRPVRPPTPHAPRVRTLEDDTD